jgi:O-acetyl-ADP-ribose deacetylase
MRLLTPQNTSLLGGGADSFTHRAAGRLVAECLSSGREARFEGGTFAGLPTVVPIWQGGAAGEQRVLESCSLSCLEIARSQGFRDIAFPAVATGVYGFPREAAARVAVATLAHISAEQQLRKLVICVCFDTATSNASRDAVGYGA